MWGLGLRLWRAFSGVGRAVTGAACIALAILALALSAAIFGPLALRGPALLGAFGALVALQLLVMWSLRGMQDGAIAGLARFSVAILPVAAICSKWNTVLAGRAAACS